MAGNYATRLSSEEVRVLEVFRVLNRDRPAKVGPWILSSCIISPRASERELTAPLPRAPLQNYCRIVELIARVLPPKKHLVGVISHPGLTPSKEHGSRQRSGFCVLSFL